jgi:VIT1/CCC1 family predicted Fe2+/Mn2+ transporter
MTAMATIQTASGAPPAHHHEDWHTPHGRMIREVVFGANDGLVTMIGFVAGATGALSSTRPIILASEVLILAGSVSMAIGAYLSSKAQREFFEHEIARERWEIEQMPDMETAEVRDHYKTMGFAPAEVEMITRRITSDPKLWLRFMMHEELGLVEESFDNPVKSGLIVGGAYFAAAWVPVAPYFFIHDIPKALTVACVLAVGSMALMGIAKAHITGTSAWKSSGEVAILGTLAMLVGYVGSRIASSILP